MEIQNIAGAIGAEISGLDLALPLSDATIAEIRAVWLDRLVVFFRESPLTPAQYLAFARRFGEVIEYPFIKGLADFPEITPVVKLEHETVNFGGVWHSDTTYLERPPMGSMLLAREAPPFGGDTLFANQYLAYERLSPAMQQLLSGLTGINCSSKADASRTREDRIRAGDGAAKASAEFTGEHPVVRTHFETGRKALYVNVAHTTGFKGWTEAESAGLLRFLFQHQTKPEFTCRFRWQSGSLAFWDNRAAQHNPINDYHGYRRVMHRITFAGDRPR
jgi:taurine dioxygenase